MRLATWCDLSFKFLDPTLGSFKCLVLHDNGLRHIVGRSWLFSDTLLDEPFSFDVALARLLLDLSELGEQTFNGLLVITIHQMFPRNGWDLLFTLAGEVEQQLEDVDEVQVERQGTKDGDLLL